MGGTSTTANAMGDWSLPIHANTPVTQVHDAPGYVQFTNQEEILSADTAYGATILVYIPTANILLQSFHDFDKSLGVLAIGVTAENACTSTVAGSTITLAAGGRRPIRTPGSGPGLDPFRRRLPEPHRHQRRGRRGPLGYRLQPARGRRPRGYREPPEVQAGPFSSDGWPDHLHGQGPGGRGDHLATSWATSAHHRFPGSRPTAFSAAACRKLGRSRSVLIPHAYARIGRRQLLRLRPRFARRSARERVSDGRPRIVLILLFEDVFKSFRPGAPVLRGMNLIIERGEFVFITGPKSGSASRPSSACSTVRSPLTRGASCFWVGTWPGSP